MKSEKSDLRINIIQFLYIKSVRKAYFIIVCLCIYTIHTIFSISFINMYVLSSLFGVIVIYCQNDWKLFAMMLFSFFYRLQNKTTTTTTNSMYTKRANMRLLNFNSIQCTLGYVCALHGENFLQNERNEQKKNTNDNSKSMYE